MANGIVHRSVGGRGPGRFRGDLPDRTYEFAKVIVDLVDDLPENAKGWVIAKQLVKCDTSIGANVSEASEAISDAEFTQRCSVARKEARETHYWLRLCSDKGLIRRPELPKALADSDEIVRILATIVQRMQQRSSNVAPTQVAPDGNQPAC